MRIGISRWRETIGVSQFEFLDHQIGLFVDYSTGITFMVKKYYIYGGSRLLHLWLKSITFMVGRLLHLWLKSITFMVGITFMVKKYYIYGGYYIYGWYYIYGRCVTHKCNTAHKCNTESKLKYP